MSKFNSSIVAYVGGPVLFLTLLAAGCADLITYSRESQREGIKLYRQGDYANAAGAFRNSVRQNPRNYQGYYYLGASYEQIGQYQQAIQAYKTARQTIGLTVDGRSDDEFRMAIVDGLAGAIAKSDQRDVETDAAQRDAQTRGGGEAWFLLARIYAYRGDADSSVDAFNRAALLDPDNFHYQKEYGLYLERIGQPRRAEAPLRRAYSLNNQDPQVAQALRRIGVVPGPSIMDESKLAKPLIPKGPIPELEVPRLGLPGGSSSGSTVEAPQD